MSKRNRYTRWSNDSRIFGQQVVEVPQVEGEEPLPDRLYLHRSRKARRAQARLDGLKWRDMSLEQRLMQ